MSSSVRCLIAAAIACAFAAPVLPQSLPNLPLTRLGYTVRKRTVNPQGELKEKIDAVDRELAEATKQGKIGEVRRLIAKGQALLNGTAWTDALDYSNSLVVRSDRIFVDTAKPYTARLEQIYSPSIDLQHAVTAHVTLHKPGAPAANLAGAGARPPGAELAKDLGTFDDVSRDLRESPFLMELDLSGVADGPYQLQVEVLDGAKQLGAASMRIVAQKGLEATLERLAAGANSLPERLRPDVDYPLDYIRNVNLGRVEMRPFNQFDLGKELANAEQTLAAAKTGKDPFAGRTGDFKRHYFLQTAKEIMPYRLYVPPACSSKTCPLVVALHGLGGTEDSMFGANYGVPAQAEKHGFIAVAPMGYRIDGFYGYSPLATAARATEFSEQDVMEVLKLVRRDYKIDENRIYLMGHSMGGIGTWALGAKYPTVWAALGPISGLGNPATVENMRQIPEVVV
ncbi:MAG TPA: PHB depolymerase family esterase, partial [Bryobacteraceae bacterium]|nr:PHB depolymerase family esterase [Bryobacteraceae bacterium]